MLNEKYLAEYADIFGEAMQDFTIPPLPAVVAQVIQFNADDPRNGPADLEKIVAPDKAISADLLRVANSAFYGRSGKVKLLKEALAVLGIKATKNLVIYLSTRSMTCKYKSETFTKYLTKYPIYAALSAQAIASATSHRQLAEEAFLAALLHNIGMNLLAQQKEGHYSDMLLACEKNKWDLKKLEKQSYGITHSELGKKAAEQWKLPPIYQKLMEISPASDVATLSEPVEKLTFLAAVVAAVILGIPVSDAARQSAQALFATLGGSGDLFARFASEDAQKKIQEHPFLQLAA